MARSLDSEHARAGEGPGGQAVLEDAGDPVDLDRTSSPALHALALVTLVAGVLQAVAVVVLGTAEVDDVKRAASEGVGAYVLAALISVACLWGVYLSRRRPAISLPVLLSWPLLVYLPLRRALSPLGLAYHGEFILYHFLGLVGAAVCVWVPLRWAYDPILRARLGPLRWSTLPPAILGGLALLVAQIARVSSLRVETASGLATVGALCMLATWVVAVASTWRWARPSGARVAAALLIVPVVVRVLLTGDGGVAAGLRGAPVAAGATVWVGAAIVAVAVAVAGLLRPRLEIWLQALIAAVCILAVTLAWAAYTHWFGILEDGLDGIARSFLGFSLPYPAYVPTWRKFGFMLGLFFVLATIYTCLVSTRDRNRGVGLGLLAVAGIGLSSPHLVMLMTAGILVFVDTLVDPVQQQLATRLDHTGASPSPAPKAGRVDGDIELRELLARVAGRLGAPEPVAIDELSVLRDELDGVVYELRSRAGRKPELLITVGLPGRGAPSFELVPDAGQAGHRPAHLLARSHRVVGDARTLESVGDRPLDALTRLPRARVRAWDAGWETELSGCDALADADADALESVVRALVRAVQS